MYIIHSFIKIVLQKDYTFKTVIKLFIAVLFM